MFILLFGLGSFFTVPLSRLNFCFNQPKPWAWNLGITANDAFFLCECKPKSVAITASDPQQINFAKQQQEAWHNSQDVSL